MCCVYVNCGVLLCWIYMSKMVYISLEDEDYNELFITQMPSSNLASDFVESDKKEEGCVTEGHADGMRNEECSAFFVAGQPVYSDISDHDVFQQDESNFK